MTNSISIPFPTSVPDVYATKNAVSLAERFFSCPTAAKLLDSERFIKPILIDTQNISGAVTYTSLDNNNPLRAKILIAEEDLETSESLRNLAIEIFNAQRTASDLDTQARLGNMGMD